MARTYDTTIRDAWRGVDAQQGLVDVGESFRIRVGRGKLLSRAHAERWRHRYLPRNDVTKRREVVRNGRIIEAPYDSRAMAASKTNSE